MKTQVYASKENTEKFIASINKYRQCDPRLNNPQFAKMLGISSGYFGKIVNRKERLAQDLFDKWFDTLEHKLSRRIKDYQSLSIDELIAYIIKNLRSAHSEVEKTLLITDDRLKIAVKRKRLRTLLNVYDVMKGYPLYRDIDNSENKESIRSNGGLDLIQKTIEQLQAIIKNTSNINLINAFLLPSNPTIYARLLRSPYHRLRASNRELLEDSYEKLVIFRKTSDEYTKFVGNANQISIKRISELARKNISELCEESETLLNKPYFFKNRDTGEIVKTISRHKAIVFLTIEACDSYFKTKEN